MKNLAVLTAAVFTLVGCGGGGGSSTSAPTITQPPVVAPIVYVKQSTCEFAPVAKDFVVGDYELRNDRWGVDIGNVKPATAFTQCMSVLQLTPNSFQAQWNWKFATDAVITGLSGYPGILYGKNPGGAKSTNSKLPMAVSDVGNLSVKYDMTVNATGFVQTFFDLYFASTKAANLSEMTHEVSISIRAPQWIGAHVLIGTTTVDDMTFDVYLGKTSLQHADQIVWVSHKDYLKGTLNVKKFIDYMVARNLMKPTEYLASIEFGTEPSAGEGEIVVNSYSIVH